MKFFISFFAAFFVSLYFVSEPVHFDELTLRKLREGRFYGKRDQASYSAREISEWTGETNLRRALGDESFPRRGKKSGRKRAPEAR